MKFSFPVDTKFKCVQCGNCCSQGSISITENEAEYLKYKTPSKIVSIEKNDIVCTPFEVYFEEEYCPFFNKETRLCSEYANRFFMCKFYPFTFYKFLDGEIHVDLIYCSGINNQEGATLDKTYFENHLASTKKNNLETANLYLNRKTFVLDQSFPAYSLFDSTSVKNKVDIRNYMKELISNEICRDLPPPIKIMALKVFFGIAFGSTFKKYVELLGYNKIKRSNQIYLVDVDIAYINNEINKRLKLDWDECVEYSKQLEDKTLNEIKTSGIVPGGFGREKNNASVNDELEFLSRNGVKLKAKYKKICADVSWTSGAILAADNYFIELLSRFGSSGIPIVLSAIEIWDVLDNVAFALSNNSKMFSNDSFVKENDVLNSIFYLDKRTISMSLSIKIMQKHREYFSSFKNPS